MSDANRRLNGTVLGSALTAANEIHIALCHTSNRYATRALTRALHNVLIVAEEARQNIAQAIDEEERKLQDEEPTP